MTRGDERPFFPDRRWANWAQVSQAVSYMVIFYHKMCQKSRRLRFFMNFVAKSIAVPSRRFHINCIFPVLLLILCIEAPLCTYILSISLCALCDIFESFSSKVAKTPLFYRFICPKKKRAVLRAPLRGVRFARRGTPRRSGWR